MTMHAAHWRRQGDDEEDLELGAAVGHPVAPGTRCSRTGSARFGRFRLALPGYMGFNGIVMRRQRLWLWMADGISGQSEARTQRSVTFP